MLTYNGRVFVLQRLKASIKKYGKYYLKIHAKILGEKIRPTRPTAKLLAPLPSGAAVAILLMLVTRVFFLLAPLAPPKNNQNPKHATQRVLTF
jgi:hypothetical protein